VPLPASASVDGQLLYLPLAVVTDVFPRVGSGVLYDSGAAELRLFAAFPGKGQHAAMTSNPADADRIPGNSTIFAPMPIRAPSPSPSPPGEPATRSGIAERDSVGIAPSGDVLLGETGASVAAMSARSASTRRRLVVVDAGHGGPDNGMSGPLGAATPLFFEKDIALAVAMKVGRELRSRGIDVVQTRTRDTLIALSDRGRIANEQHGDLFLSIHVNAANMAWHDPAASRGFETYFLAEAKTEDARRVERMENEAVRFETGANAAQDEPLDFVIHDMAQNEQLRESAELADMIQHSLAGIHPGPDRGVKQAGFRVLVTAYMPAVLVEIGFGTNSDEAH
jgi:N-acetylmuramoyl-L-alanine amidase